MAPWSKTTWFMVDAFRGMDHVDHPRGQVMVCPYDPRRVEHAHSFDYARPSNPMGVWGEKQRANRLSR